MCRGVYSSSIPTPLFQVSWGRFSSHNIRIASLRGRGEEKAREGKKKEEEGKKNMRGEGKRIFQKDLGKVLTMLLS